MKKIITVSLVAMMAVTAARADIASTTYVDSRTGNVANSTFVKTLETGKQNLSGAVDALADKLSTGSLTIAKDAVGTEQLANDAVTADKLATNSVLSDNIQDGEVKTDDIADSAVTSAKILNGTIVDADIAVGANIAQSKIAGLGDALNAKEDVSNKANQITGNMNKEQMYPTVALTESLISGANQDMSDLIGEVADGKTVVQMITEGDGALDLRVTDIEESDYATSGITAAKVGTYDGHVADKNIHVTTDDKAAWNAKVNTAQGADNKDKAMITDGNGNVKPGEIVSGMIKDGEVKTDDIATNAVTTAKILDKNVTLGKLHDSVQASLGKADSAMQEVALKGLTSWTDQKCGTTGVTCSLVSKDGTITWEAVKY